MVLIFANGTKCVRIGNVYNNQQIYLCQCHFYYKPIKIIKLIELTIIILIDKPIILLVKL